MKAVERKPHLYSMALVRHEGPVASHATRASGGRREQRIKGTGRNVLLGEVGKNGGREGVAPAHAHRTPECPPAASAFLTFCCPKTSSLYRRRWHEWEGRWGLFCGLCPRKSFFWGLTWERASLANLWIIKTGSLYSVPCMHLRQSPLKSMSPRAQVSLRR